MAFANIGSAEANLSPPTWSGSGSTYTTTIAVAVPDLGANRVGVVCCSFQAAPGNLTNITAITWDGGAVTLTAPVGAAAAGYSIGGHRIGMTDNATIDVVITATTNDLNTPAVSNLFVTIAWADAGAAILFDDDVQASGTAQNVEIDTPISAAGLVISQTGSAANALAATPFPDGTTLQNWDQGGNCFMSGYTTPAGAGTINHTHAYSQIEAYTGVGIAFIEDGGGGGTSRRPSTRMTLGIGR